jgi:hypothetical protein
MMRDKFILIRVGKRLVLLFILLDDEWAEWYQQYFSETVESDDAA